MEGEGERAEEKGKRGRQGETWATGGRGGMSALQCMAEVGQVGARRGTERESGKEAEGGGNRACLRGWSR